MHTSFIFFQTFILYNYVLIHTKYTTSRWELGSQWQQMQLIHHIRDHIRTYFYSTRIFPHAWNKKYFVFIHPHTLKYWQPSYVTCSCAACVSFLSDLCYVAVSTLDHIVAFSNPLPHNHAYNLSNLQLHDFMK